MTMFSATASPGQRWKMFLPDAASVQGDVLSVIAASALIRSRWLSVRTHARGGYRCVAAPGFCCISPRTVDLILHRCAAITPRLCRTAQGASLVCQDARN